MAQSDDGSLIEQGTPLTRNHWFDGKFLRADDLARDQDYQRAALRLANQAGGFGVVHGLEVGLAGNEILLQPGLGLNADGELLLLNSELVVGVEALIAASEAAAAAAPATDGNSHFAACEAEAQAAEPAPAAGGLRVYWLTLSPHQALCGHEDVVGALCERACVTERQRPYKLEGVRLRARRINLQLPALPGLEAGGRHARSRIASLLFGRDDARISPLPDNGGRLLSPLWCSGAELQSGRELRLGVLVRGAGTADFIDLWTGRRERMATQAEGYWRRRTRQRPYADFIAQVAQFQCQLTQLFRDAAPPADGGGDCGALKALVADLERQLEAAQQEDEQENRRAAAIDYERAASVQVMRRIGRFVLQAQPLLQGRADRLLLERGIVELPPAGFLPVSPNGGPLERQLQDWVGPGLRLQICSAPLDAIGHLFGQAQHSARTSLTHGIADPADKPLLQIIVPDGEAGVAPVAAPGYAVGLQVDPAVMLVALTRLLAVSAEPPPPATVAPPGVRPPVGGALPQAPVLAVGSAARLDSAFAAGSETLAEGAGRVLTGSQPGFAQALRGRSLPAGTAAASEDFAAAWSEAVCGSDPFAAAPGAQLPLALDLHEADQPGAELPAGSRVGIAMRLRAQLVLDSDPSKAEAARAEIERFTGASGGELRMAALQDGELRYVRHLQGIPGRDDGAGDEVLQRFAAPLLVLQRVGAQLLVALPVAKAGLLIFEHRPQADGSSRLLLRIVSFAEQQPGGNLSHGFGGGALAVAGEQQLLLASLRPDAQALAAGAAPRVAAETGLERLAVAGVGVAAAARERLFASVAGAPAPLRALHDWVLFRRLVDARCGVQAAPPPVVVEPPPPPKLTRYQAIVLRVNAVAGVDHLGQALALLRQGELPNGRVASAANAGEISYVGEAELPQASQTYLVAQFGRAGFAPPVAGVFVANAAGVAPALEQRRFTKLTDLLGGGAVPVEAMPQRPPTLPASEAEGTLIYLLPPNAEVPPPPPARLTRQHRVLLISGIQMRRQQISFDALRQMLAGNEVNDVIKRLQDLSGRPPQLLNFGWPVAAGGTLEAVDSELALIANLLPPLGGFDQPPHAICVAQTTAQPEDMRRCGEELFFIAGRLNDSSAVPTTALVRSPVLLDTFSGSTLMHALTLLFTKH